MKTLGIVAQKGGAGKTTLTVHLATFAQQQGLSVLVVDTDQQKSLSKWAHRRKDKNPSVLYSDVVGLPVILKKAKDKGFDLVIVDTAPSHSGETAQVSRLVDFSIIPSRPAILDIDAISNTTKLLHQVSAKAAIVLNACPHGRGGENSTTTEVRHVLKGAEFEVCPFSITQRAAFGHALIDGRAVNEFEPTGKAAKEISNLWFWINKKLGGDV
jgi:chromosome partitioning protein